MRLASSLDLFFKLKFLSTGFQKPNKEKVAPITFDWKSLSLNPTGQTAYFLWNKGFTHLQINL
jgi:hypothetical protein